MSLAIAVLKFKVTAAVAYGHYVYMKDIVATMLPVSRILLPIILGVVVQYVDGNQRIIHVSELPNDRKDFVTSGEDDNSLICCVYGNCSCSSLDHALANLTSNVLINITTDVTLSSLVTVSGLENVSIIGHNNPTVNFRSVEGIQFTFSHHLIIRDITWNGCNTENTQNHTEPGLKFSNSSNVMIQNCTFQKSIGQAVVLSELSGEVDIKDCNFINNYNYKDHGALIHYTSQAASQCSQHFFMISNCNFTYNEGASLVYIEHRYSECNNNIAFHCTIFYSNKGISIYVLNQRLRFYGNSLFQSNSANDSAGIYISDHSTVIFDNNSDVTFVHNFANRGIAVFLRNRSSITFDENSTVTFHDNTGTNGTVYADTSSNVTFKGNCRVTFSNNSATYWGAAIYSRNHSCILFTGNSNVTFINNVVTNTEIYELSGGIIWSGDNSCISFKENSQTLFIKNDARFYGGAVISCNHSHISFEGTSNTTFRSNKAHQHGGAIFSEHNSSISFKENSISVFTNNTAGRGGVIRVHQNSNILFDENSTAKFSCNTADFDGGVIYSFNSQLRFKGHSNVTINNNKALLTGGAISMHCESQLCCRFGGNSSIMFSDNDASYGGAMSIHYSKISFEGHAQIAFLRNKAVNNGGSFELFIASIITLKEFANVIFENNNACSAGGAIYLKTNSNITLKDNSTALFKSNRASDGGAIHMNGEGQIYICIITLEKFANVTFENNSASSAGGAIHLRINSDITFKDNSTALFINNRASDGGAINMNCKQLCCRFGGNSSITFCDNNALYGGAMYTEYSEISFEGDAQIVFLRNKAVNNGGSCNFSFSVITLKECVNVTFENNNASSTGGAIHLNNNTNIAFIDNSTALFKNNRASDGGAIGTSMNSIITVQDYTRITFVTNNAVFGGAMFFDATHTALVLHQDKDINFISNTARIAGDYMYFNSTESSNSCLNNRIIGINNETKHFIATPPNKLQFYTPATCIQFNDDDKIECNTYHLRHIMLGEEIIVPASVLNYCNQPSIDVTQFVLHGGENYNISGPKQVLISGNDTFHRISIIGNHNSSKPSNYTINLILHDACDSYWKHISVNLTVELTPCHPGFWQDPGSEKCECYSTEDIVYCSGSSSTIKRGYWFGSVTGKPTVTFCPINYCNFTCCEASNGYYHLSPVRDNQCRSHRSGTACGSCTDGYTLSFDSPECVDVDSCTAGQTVLVILLTVTYWIVMVTLVFAMMYYKVPIGYLYSITYYYSIVDILLSENLQASRGLYLTVSIISSFSKITPQFLGELCLTTGMSGIDQYFIHFVHPSVVLLILIIISLSARSSRRISAFISRGIIHVICLLLLLSYTSIASTSLLLMRSLTFHEIDKIYTYLSPDIEYFHGRHLAYGIAALVCTITIVVGLPLLLILEPVLNRKINFAKIKPLLDQFQGCYKDKFRCFAGYYMICRLVIITIIIANSNEFLASYLLIVVCVVIALIHVTARPYNNEIVNKFDALILLLVIFNTGLHLLDDFDSQLSASIVFVLIFLPLLTLTAITLFLHKNDFKKIAKHFAFKDKASTNGNSDNVHNKEVPMKEFDLIVDDSVRNNATITVCDT